MSTATLTAPQPCVSYDEPKCPHCGKEIVRGHVDWFWRNGLRRMADDSAVVVHSYCDGIIAIGRELHLRVVAAADLHQYPWWPEFSEALSNPSKRRHGP